MLSKENDPEDLGVKVKSSEHMFFKYMGDLLLQL